MRLPSEVDKEDMEWSGEGAYVFLRYLRGPGDLGGWEGRKVGLTRVAPLNKDFKVTVTILIESCRGKTPLHPFSTFQKGQQ